MKTSQTRGRSAQRLADLGEFRAIDLFRRACTAGGTGPWRIGIGDDTAVLARPRRGLLVTVDALVERRHFQRDWSTPAELARKAFACNVSDIAAMGGTPLGAVLALGAPADTSARWLAALARGFARAASHFGCPLVGGDTVGADQLVLSVTMLGQVAARAAVTRSGAQPGDVLCVTGRLGESELGLRLLGELPPGAAATADARRRLARRFGAGSAMALRRHLSGHAQPRAGVLLARHGAHAMIDISDGLASELWHIARASGVRLTLDADAVPVAPVVQRVAPRLGLDPFEVAWSGGEDYELLVAMPSRRVSAARAALAREARVALHVVGRVESSGRAHVDVVDTTGRRRALRARGFDHYRSQETP